jgi:hypothetical protein
VSEETPSRGQLDDLLAKWAGALRRRVNLSRRHYSKTGNEIDTKVVDVDETSSASLRHRIKPPLNNIQIPLVKVKELKQHYARPP